MQVGKRAGANSNGWEPREVKGGASADVSVFRARDSLVVDGFGGGSTGDVQFNRNSKSSSSLACDLGPSEKIIVVFDLRTIV